MPRQASYEINDDRACVRLFRNSVQAKRAPAGSNYGEPIALFLVRAMRSEVVMIPVPRFPSPASVRNSVVPWKPPPRRCDWRVLVKKREHRRRGALCSPVECEPTRRTMRSSLLDYRNSTAALLAGNFWS